MLLNIGDKAPDFTLFNQNGANISLNDIKGQTCIIWFFPKANTPGWTVEGQGFRDEFKKFDTQNMKIFGVSGDSVVKQKKFHDKQKFNFDLLSDEEHSMLEAYKVWGLKKFMGREYMGIHRVTYVINPEGEIHKVYDKVKTKTHAQDILNDL